MPGQEVPGAGEDLENERRDRLERPVGVVDGDDAVLVAQTISVGTAWPGRDGRGR